MLPKQPGWADAVIGSVGDLLKQPPAAELAISGYRFRRAETDGEREMAYRLRHQIFLSEGFIEAGASEGFFFRDRFDDFSVCFLAFGEAADPIGTTRLVTPSDYGFPTEELFDFPLPPVERSRLGEFGRLAVLREHRGGARVPMLGLIKMVYDCACEQNIRFVYAFMAPKLVASFARLGLHAQPLAVEQPTAETLIRRRPMQGYFSRNEIQPVLFDRIAVEKLLGV